MVVGGVDHVVNTISSYWAELRMSTDYVTAKRWATELPEIKKSVHIRNEIIVMPNTSFELFKDVLECVWKYIYIYIYTYIYIRVYIYTNT